jgi:hypothetical protein
LDKLIVSLSDSVTVVDNSDYSIVHEVTGFTTGAYVVSYYSAGQMNNITEGGDKVNAGGPIFSRIGVFNPSAGTVQFPGPPEIFNASSPSFYIVGAKIDNSSIVLVYADQAINYGLTAVLLSCTASTGVIQFGSTLQLTTGQALMPGSRAVMDLDVAAVPPSAGGCGSSDERCTRNSFSVLYGDATNNGVVTLVSGKVRLLLVLQLFSKFACDVSRPSV